MFKKIVIGFMAFVFVLATPVSAATKKVVPKIPTGATALCKDGTYSYSKNHKGTCSGHKGVKTWYK